MGDKQSYGHDADTYTLEDSSSLVSHYDKYLAPFLSITNPREPDEFNEAQERTPLAELRMENQLLREQLVMLANLLADRMVTPQSGMKHGHPKGG